MTRRACVAVALAATSASACAPTVVVPRVTPARVEAVQPPIPRRALLLLTPAFAGFSATNVHDGPPIPTQSGYELGPAASSLLQDWVARSFAGAEVRRLSDAEALRLFVTGEGAGGAEVLLLPRFELTGEPYERRAWRPSRFVASLRVDARSLATGAVRSWGVRGRSGGEGFFAEAGAPSGRALERAVEALRDTVAANRGAL